MRMTPTTRSVERGMTMIEVAIALAIGMMVIASVIGIYSMGAERRAIAEAETNIRLIERDVRQIWADDVDYSALTEVTAINMGAIPETMVRAPDQIRHAWGGEVQVKPAAAAPQRLEIDYREVPERPCIQLGTYTEGEWINVRINGTSVDGSPDAARGSCNEAPTNRVVFVTR